MSPEQTAYRKRIVSLVKELVQIPAAIRYAYLQALRNPRGTRTLTEKRTMIVLNNLTLYDEPEELDPATDTEPRGLHLVHSRPPAGNAP